jgi:hypothetical protein
MHGSFPDDSITRLESNFLSKMVEGMKRGEETSTIENV